MFEEKNIPNDLKIRWVYNIVDSKEYTKIPSLTILSELYYNNLLIGCFIKDDSIKGVKLSILDKNIKDKIIKIIEDNQVNIWNGFKELRYSILMNEK